MAKDMELELEGWLATVLLAEEAAVVVEVVAVELWVVGLVQEKGLELGLVLLMIM